MQKPLTAADQERYHSKREMGTPNFQKFFLPLLEIASDGREYSTKEAKIISIDKMSLTEDDLQEKIRSGKQTKVDNRIWWAKSYFVQAKVFSSPKRGVFKITERGKELLSQGHSEITVKELSQYPEFLKFTNSQKTEEESTGQITPIAQDYETPEEVLLNSYEEIRSSLANELLDTIKSNSYEFFENLVIDLLIALGYGGSRADAGQSIGKVGDEGIDGIINEDKLGLDVIYLQAKKWEGSVSRPEIQKFVGALHEKRAKKGVFITTGTFTNTAIEYVRNIDPKVVLIDGKTLVNYMIDYNLGVSLSMRYEIKKIDSDYFIDL